MIKEVTTAHSYFNDTGVENGIEYHYYIVACNIGGEGDPSDIVKGKPSGRPGPPIDLQFVQTKGNVNITWDPPLDTGGLEIMYYNVYRIENGNESDPRVKVSFDEEYLDTFVLPYFNYTYWITAVNPKGEGPPSGKLVVKTSMPTSKPIDLEAVSGNGFAEISWGIPKRLNDGVEILHYMVYRNGSFISEAGLDRIFNETGLTNAVTYRYSVSAFTLIGEGDLSDEIEVRPFTIPGKPRNLSSSSIGDNVTLLWKQPLSDGGSIITKYIVEKVEMGVQTFYSESPVNTYADYRVMRGRNLTYRVSGVNAAGQGPFSDPVSVFIDPGMIPKEPRNLKAILTGDGIRLTWEEPSDIKEPILSYKIFRMAEGISQYSFLTGTEEGSYLDKDIGPNMTYRYRVTASSRSGEGPFSEEVRITIGSDYVPAQGPDDDKLVLKIILAVVGAILLAIIIGLVIVLRGPAPKVNVPKDNQVLPQSLDEVFPPVTEDIPIERNEGQEVVPPENALDPLEPTIDPSNVPGNELPADDGSNPSSSST